MGPIKVMLHGFDQRATDRMRNLFRINFRDRCVLAEGEPADIVVADLDALGANARDLLSSLDPRKTVLFSEQGRGPEGFRVLAKPVKLQQLREALFPASAESAERTIGLEATSVSRSAAETLNARVVPPAREGNSRGVRKLGTDIRYRPCDYFIGSVLEALSRRHTHRAVQLTTWDFQRLIFYPEANRIYSDLRRSRLRPLAATPLAENLRSQMQVTGLATLPLRGELDGMEVLDLERTLWELAYSSSRGRVPEHLDLSRKYRLSRWPNFTRLPDVPNGMRIAAVWAGDPQRLDDIATRLGVDAGEVYAFYAGAAALGLTEQTAEIAEPVIERSITDSTRGLLGALLGHLGSALKPRPPRLGEPCPAGERA